jgi:hypothetical protein
MRRMMKIATPVVALALLVAAGSRASAQSGTSDPFNGSWRLSAGKSAAAWQSQPQPRRPVPDPQSHGLITMKIANGMMDYRVEHGAGTGQPKQASYTAAYNDARWQPVLGSPDGAYSAITLVKITDRQHYWVTRSQDGQFAGVTLRKMADDGRSFTSIGIGPDGYVQYARVFEKQ